MHSTYSQNNYNSLDETSDQPVDFENTNQTPSFCTRLTTQIAMLPKIHLDGFFWQAAALAFGSKDSDPMDWKLNAIKGSFAGQGVFFGDLIMQFASLAWTPSARREIRRAPCKYIAVALLDSLLYAIPVAVAGFLWSPIAEPSFKGLNANNSWFGLLSTMLLTGAGCGIGVFGLSLLLLRKLIPSMSSDTDLGVSLIQVPLASAMFVLTLLSNGFFSVTDETTAYFDNTDSQAGWNTSMKVGLSTLSGFSIGTCLILAYQAYRNSDCCTRNTNNESEENFNRLNENLAPSAPPEYSIDNIL